MKEFGSKIRSLRRQKHLTQEELAGGQITRNMLSQIESGLATPSLSTLLYLAERLDVPIDYLVSDDVDLGAYRKQRHFPAVKKLFAAGEYQDCLQLAEVHLGDWDDDETALLRCEASLAQAALVINNGSMSPAAPLLAAVKAFAAKTVYETRHLLARAEILRAIAANPQSPRLEFQESLYCGHRKAAIHEELWHYLSDDVQYQYENPAYATHMKAKKLLQDNRLPQAYELLSGIEEHKTDQAISAYVLFRVYTDMETCAKSLRDFEDAYKYATKRMALLSAFKS